MCRRMRFAMDFSSSVETVWARAKRVLLPGCHYTE
jgi:hypothetical protein